MLRNMWYAIMHARQQNRQHQEEQHHAEIRLLAEMDRIRRSLAPTMNAEKLIRYTHYANGELHRMLSGLESRGLIIAVHTSGVPTQYSITDAGFRRLERLAVA